jgi:type IV pilus assembly protein PilN
MTRINLLPWREMRRKEERRQFFSIAAGASILMGVIVLYVHIHIGGLIAAQEQRNKYMRDEIAAVDAKITEIRALETTKQQLLARMNIIQELQTRRPEIVHIFDELVRAVPAGLHLTRISQQAGSIVIEGVAESNARVSAFMRNLDGSDWFVSPRLDVIEADAKAATRSSVFKLTVRQGGQREGSGPEGSI